METKYTKTSEKVDPAPVTPAPTEVPDIREHILNELSSEEGGAEKEEILKDSVADDREPGPSQDIPKSEKKRAKKRPLMDTVRENQLAYNKFISKKIPKLLRSIGVSSSESDSDD